MSTRRARVKAVISLPPRRKNIDNKDAKSKLASCNENINSPRTPQAKKPDERDQQSNAVVILDETETMINERVSTPQSFSHESGNNQKFNTIYTPKLNRIPALTDIFASPIAKRDSPARSVESPLAKPYKRTDLVQKVITPVGNNFGNELSIPLSTTSRDTTRSTNKADADYNNPPSVPESLTDDAVMDGIVPLKPTRSISKPLDLLKNEIISENAEVVFDIILPLPSPSKVRPKLRPVPRLMPLRRSSIQGSASESEDESRRALLSSGSHTPATQRTRHDSHTSHVAAMHSINNRELHRVRNDSVSSNLSQALTQPPLATSPLKEKHPLSKQRRTEMTRRMNSMRRRRETVKRDALTMYDLIFCNPMNNPMVPDQDELKAKEANAKDEAERKKVSEQKKEDPVEDPAPDEGAPVPQIKLGPNGEIILDEKSLVIESAAMRSVSGVVHEGAWGGGGGRYTRAARTSEWAPDETVRFYRALAALGTDFSLMAPLFPQRNRRELKLKFKKEERMNCALVDKALRSQITWDLDTLLAEFEKEREEAKLRAERERESLILERKKLKERIRAANELCIKRTRATKSIESSALPAKAYSEVRKDLTADELIQQAIEDKKARRRNKNKTQETTNTNPDPTAPNYPPITPQNKQPSSSVNYIGTKEAEPTSISKLDTLNATENSDSVVGVLPTNIENGSLVVLTVNDPRSPSKKMLQTYISHGSGKLTPVALPPSLLNSVVGYMQKGTPKSNISSGSSPQLMSPCSGASQDNRNCTTPGVLKVNPSPNKRKRLSSYSITPL